MQAIIHRGCLAALAGEVVSLAWRLVPKSFARPSHPRRGGGGGFVRSVAQWQVEVPESVYEDPAAGMKLQA